ncbi:MAG TPA: excinuclease ABC subunit A [Alphaproteobacteria bacterium]|nr:excinuclease ABC subunit A [Alphaproteobacteria bacterium]
MVEKYISVRGAKEHNLKNVSVDIPKDQLVVITGLSGSGKSSLAFDTIYAEGQRRYVESLSAYARQFLELQDKPDVEYITGLSPAIAIDQKTTSKNPRSTVATITEIYDYMRLLFARAGVPYSPTTGKPIERQTVQMMADKILELPEGTKIYLLAPIVRGGKGEHIREMLNLKKDGYTRIKIDGQIHSLEELPTVDKNKKHDMEVVVDRLKVDNELGNRLPSSIETSLQLSNGLLYVEIVELPEKYKGPKKVGDIEIFSEKFACPESGFQLSEIEPRMFSFNSPYGACTACDGLGTELFYDPDLVIPNRNLSLNEGCIAPWSNSSNRMYKQTLDALSKHYKFSLDTPFNDLSEEVQDVIIYGSKGVELTFEYEEHLRSYKVKQAFEGVIPNMIRRGADADAVHIRAAYEVYQNNTDCKVCQGYRLKPETLCVKIAGLHIGEVCEMTIEKSVEWFEQLPKKLDKTQNIIAEKVIKEIRARLGFLHDVGLDYLTLDRQSGTLSGGESQRIRLASQIGSGLSGVLYVLDEPSIGLHQCDNDKLINTLKNLKALGNTVIVVEHDEDTMRQADYLIDIGPGAGVHGGHIIAEGTPEEVAKNPKSITGQYLSGKKFIDIPKRREHEKQKYIKLKGARANNLQNVDAEFPVRKFTAVTGVSGSGKSSLVLHTLNKAAQKFLNGSSKSFVGMYDSLTGLEYVDKVIKIDQSPIGRTPRSNPATYTGAFGFIRDLFVATPESKSRGYKPGRFSFNVKGGRCETCQGDGMIKIEMHFLPDVYVQCDTCKGKRYNRETLEIKYKGKSIADILDMTVEEATGFFESQPLIHEKLKALNDVGVSYIKLGQSATTLSGGEAQRIKLAKELSRKSTGRTLYILDEPTTGLHTDDIAKLLKVLHMLVDAGNTVVVIEHNLDVIKTADHIIDVGPFGGSKGGKIVGVGTPEDIAAIKDSQTGKHLKRILAETNKSASAKNSSKAEKPEKKSKKAA